MTIPLIGVLIACFFMMKPVFTWVTERWPGMPLAARLSITVTCVLGTPALIILFAIS